MKTKVLVPKEGDKSIFPIVNGVQKSAQPTEFGKTSREKNTSVIFEEKRTNRILISGVYLEASYIFTTFKKDENCATGKLVSFSISNIWMLGGHCNGRIARLSD